MVSLHFLGSKRGWNEFLLFFFFLLMKQIGGSFKKEFLFNVLKYLRKLKDRRRDVEFVSNRFVFF